MKSVATIDAIEGKPKSVHTAIQSTTPLPAASGASARNVPPAVAIIFPPFAKRRNSGRQCPIIAAPPATIPHTCET